MSYQICAFKGNWQRRVEEGGMRGDEAWLGWGGRISCGEAGDREPTPLFSER